MKALYAVHHKDCGHLIHASDDRSRAGELIAGLTMAGKWGWRIKTNPTDAELESLLRGDRCGTCTVDGSAAGGSVLFVGRPGSTS